MSRAPRPARPVASAVAVLAAATLLITGASPASAATLPGEQQVAGATAASALTLTLNLPGGAATRVVLQLDPITGTVSTATTTTATADATVLSGSLGAMALDSGTSSAKLPAPLKAESNPTGAIADGLAGTPLANLLKLELLPSRAAVTASPSSTSEAAVANLGAGLPDALADALAPLTEPLQSAIDDVLTTLAEASGTPVDQLCAGVTDAVEALDPATSAVDEALSALPVPIPVQGLLDGTVVLAICGLSTTITELNTALQGALSSLTGDSGVLGTGLVTSTQTITRAGGTTTSRAEATIADLTLLGQTPFASATVLRTASTASAAGTPGSAQASVDSTVADLTGGTVDPFLQVRTTINGIRDSFVGEGVVPAPLETLFDSVFGALNKALAPVGITVFTLDDSVEAKAISSCPATLDGLLTGTLEAADGRCAAAATRGIGLSVTLPEALATPLMIAGPLVELQIVPTAAVAKAQPAPVVAPRNLPRTGLDTGLLGAAGLVLIGGAGALLRRRRSVTA